MNIGGVLTMVAACAAAASGLFYGLFACQSPTWLGPGLISSTIVMSFGAALVPFAPSKPIVSRLVVLLAVPLAFVAPIAAPYIPLLPAWSPFLQSIATGPAC